MPKMTDQEFDNLFRQAANRTTHEPDATDWEDMQRRLEAAERDARARNISLYSMVALLLLYSFIVPDQFKSNYNRASFLQVTEDLQQGKTNPSGDNAAVASNDVQQPQDAVKSRAGNAANGMSSITRPLDDAGKNSVDETAENVKYHQRQRSEQASAAIEGNRPQYADRPAGNEVQAESRTDNRTQRSQETATTGGAKTDAAGEVSGQQPLSQTAHGQSGRNTITTSSTSGQISAAPLTSSGAADQGGNVTTRNETHGVTGFNTYNYGKKVINDAGPDQPSTSPLLAKPTPRLASVALSKPGRVVAFEKSTTHPLFVRLSVSPDFSSIDYGSAGKTGINFGPTVEYGLSPRFSISTGAIWSKKLYDQANPEKSYGQGGSTVKANMLNGDCRIIDIPLNVTYYMMPGRKTNLFVTVGSSSYLMLSEEYVYTITRNYKDYEYVETYSRENNEWFSMLNMSFGIQHQLNKKCFIQAEPFFKAPMKGIGEGKVNLASAGVFVSVKYWINP